jgi:hypothetical protein
MSLQKYNKERYNKLESKGKNLIKEDFCIDMPGYSLSTGRNMWHACKGTFYIKIITSFV